MILKELYFINKTSNNKNQKVAILLKIQKKIVERQGMSEHIYSES
jgi:hypothetical protein